MPEFVSLETATALVTDGCTLALGGMTLYRRPVSFVKALLQRVQPPRDLTLLCFTAGFESDLLVGAGCVQTMRSVYFGLESFGFAPMFTQAASRGEIHIVEETEVSFAMGIRAQLGGVGFMPSRAWLGTDLPRLRPDVKTVIDPYTGDTLIAFPAIPCDLAIIHGLAADAAGNVSINNNMGVDLELIYLSPIVIATVETLVDKLERSVDQTIIPAPGIHYIVPLPNGAYPTSCYPLYPVNGGEFLRYVDACNAGDFEGYLADFLKSP
jgi:glutaconate CoA-transferase, subunit A